MCNAKNYIIIALLCGLGACKQPAKETASLEETRISAKNQRLLEELDSLSQILIKDKKTPGVTYGIQIGDSEPVYQSHGYAHLEKQEKTTEQNLFRIASITKTMTAISIFQLIEAKKLELDTRLDAFFPDFPRGDSITVYHLLSHTSGIKNWYETQMPEETPQDFPMCQTPHQFIQDAKDMFLFEPGEYFYYSNTGYVLLGEIIEKVSGEEYEPYLEEHIFEPLQMENTLMEKQGRETMKWAEGYAVKDSLQNPFTVADTYYAMPYAAGGLRSTVGDLLLLMKGLNSGKLMSMDMRNTMTNYAKVNSGDDVSDKDNFYFPKDFVFPERPDYLTKYGYGLGFQRMDIFGTTAIWHGGGIAGFQTVLVHMPKSNTTLALFTNAEMPGGYGHIWEAVQRVLAKIE